MKKLRHSGILACALLASLALPQAVKAQNPVICDRYTPDPAPYVHGDTLYLFVDHDEPEDIGYFNMKDWLLYSTTDMANWTYRGTPVSTATFSKWAKQDNDAWASQCIEHNGKWYWFVTATVEGKGYPGIGCAVANSPTGPYVDKKGAPLAQGWYFIDPTVFIDDNGQPYLFWGNNGLWYLRLNPRSLYSTSGTPIKVDTNDESAFGPYKGYDDNGNPKTNYEEAPWLYKRGDTYYLEYAAGGVPEHWAYSTAKDINGPWTYQGKITDTAPGSFTIHGGTVDYKGHSYLFYHDGRLPGGGGFRRSTSIEEFTRNADGSIPYIPLTTNGVAQLEYVNPYNWVEAETINQSSGILCVGDGTDNHVTNITRNSYIKVKGVDFGTGGAASFTARVSTASAKDVTLYVKLDSKNGTTIAKLKFNDTGGLDNWSDLTADLSQTLTGVHDIYFTFHGPTTETTFMNFDRWRFNSTPSSIRETQSGEAGTPAQAYNLDGTPHKKNSNGKSVVVSKGKKIIDINN